VHDNGTALLRAGEVLNPKKGKWIAQAERCTNSTRSKLLATPEEASSTVDADRPNGDAAQCD